MEFSGDIYSSKRSLHKLTGKNLSILPIQMEGPFPLRGLQSLGNLIYILNYYILFVHD
ncbi:hypothetical protein LguiB_017433 [Lonicera macranthoides]